MNDKTLRQYVLDELNWEPSVDSAHIDVVVDRGVVTLTGHVPNFTQKSAVESAVRRVKGVRGLAEELWVDYAAGKPYLDDDIAKRALDVLDLNVLVPPGAIQVMVQHGRLTLTGEVRWDYQRMAAVADLSKLRGVTGITNDIEIKPQVHAGKVSLEGLAPSWADRQTVERGGWAAPGARRVEDHLRII